MSIPGSPPPPDMMRNHLLRSSTPASNEKVLLYLEGMKDVTQEPVFDDDKASSVRSGRTGRTGTSKRRGSRLGPNGSVAGSTHRFEEDLRSDVQEQPQSEIARTIPIHTTGFVEQEPEHEPGPNDPPGPRFESYGSSFGNFGPLRDSLPPPINNWGGQQPWQAQSPTMSNKAAGVQPPENTGPLSPITDHSNPFGQFGMAPMSAAGVPLPTSVLSGPSRRTGAPSKAASQKMTSGAESPARALSPARTTNGGAAPDRPWSPRTAASQQPSAVKSRVTQKTGRTGTVYPPLPESTMGGQTHRSTPPPRTHNRSPSIAPSESASQVPKMRRAPSQKEPSHKPSKSIKSTTELNNGGAPEAPRSSLSKVVSQRDAPSQVMSVRSQHTQQLPPQRTGGTNDELRRAASNVLSPSRSQRNLDPETTPTPSRPPSPPIVLTADEQMHVDNLLRRPARSRTSFALSTLAPSMLEPEVQNTHFHDRELCELLHSLDDPMPEPVKKAVRKAVRQRVKRLGMKYDNESIKQYRKSFHDHSPDIHLAVDVPPSVGPGSAVPDEPPQWAKDLNAAMLGVQQQLNYLAPKIEKTVERSFRSSRGPGSSLTQDQSYANDNYQYGQSDAGYTRSPLKQGLGPEAMEESMYTEPIRDSTILQTIPSTLQPGGGMPDDDLYDDQNDAEHLAHGNMIEDDTHSLPPEFQQQQPYDPNQQYSPGYQHLEEELYKLRVKPTTGSQSVAATHKTWEVAREDGDDYDGDDAQAAVTESGLPEIPDAHTGNYTERSLPPLPTQGEQLLPIPDGQPWAGDVYGTESRGPPPWQRVHQRLLSWAIVWPMSELDNALTSTTRGHQVDEIALSIWSTQTYKRYVRSKMTDSPPGRVDRLFVPPNMADAISTAVYNGRHGDACGMLRDLWEPFGLEGIPRLLIVLAKHRSDDNHWVAHRFSLPDGSLTTYDTYPERSLPDGRPLGWWFAIRLAWPDAIYPSPDRLMQKMVRLHRPTQLPIDNSVAAAGIWRNLLMGSRAERSLDLERLRDLINTEVKNLRQRKAMGKLSIQSPRPNWEDMH